MRAGVRSEIGRLSGPDNRGSITSGRHLRLFGFWRRGGSGFGGGGWSGDAGRVRLAQEITVKPGWEMVVSGSQGRVKLTAVLLCLQFRGVEGWGVRCGLSLPITAFCLIDVAGRSNPAIQYPIEN